MDHHRLSKMATTEARRGLNYEATLMPSSSTSSFWLDQGGLLTEEHQAWFASSSTANPNFLELDPRLWSRLPSKVIERIIACLPPPVFFRLRMISKSLYGLLFSESFLQMCSESAPHRPWFMALSNQEGFFLDPESLTWHRAPPLNALPSVFTVAGSSGGLLCCVPETAGCKTVVILNPLTRECVQLPATLKERFAPSVALLRDTDTKSYRVMLAGDDMISPFAVKNLTTEIYDSALQFWTIAGALPRLCNLEPSGRMAHVKGSLYCMNYTPYAVLSYDLERQEWNKIQAPMRRFLRSPSVVGCKKRVLMVAGVQKSKLNVPRSIRVWELQENGWGEIERMPQSLHDQFVALSPNPSDYDFKCVGHGDYVMLTCAKSPHVVVFDAGRKSWSWAPICPVVNPASGIRGFAFDPRLDASVC